MTRVQRNVRQALQGIRPSGARPAAIIPVSLPTLPTAQRATRATVESAVAAPLGDGRALIQEASMGRASPTALVFKTAPTPERELKEFRVTLDGVLG